MSKVLDQLLSLTRALDLVLEDTLEIHYKCSHEEIRPNLLSQVSENACPCVDTAIVANPLGNMSFSLTEMVAMLSTLSTRAPSNPATLQEHKLVVEEEKIKHLFVLLLRSRSLVFTRDSLEAFLGERAEGHVEYLNRALDNMVTDHRGEILQAPPYSYSSSSSFSLAHRAEQTYNSDPEQSLKASVKQFHEERALNSALVRSYETLWMDLCLAPTKLLTKLSLVELVAFKDLKTDELGDLSSLASLHLEAHLRSDANSDEYSSRHLQVAAFQEAYKTLKHL